MRRYKATISEFRKSGNFLMPPIMHKIGGSEGAAKTEILKSVRDRVALIMKTDDVDSINISIKVEK